MERYYPQSGYLTADRFGIEVPDRNPAKNFMEIQLAEGASVFHGSAAKLN